MAETFELELSFTSPYKRTRLFIQRGRAFFGIWQPLDFVLDGDEEEITVQEGREGTLEYIAGQVYGDRALWRVIAQANLIDFPMRDVVPGLSIKIPKPAKVRAALLAVAREQRAE